MGTPKILETSRTIVGLASLVVAVSSLAPRLVWAEVADPSEEVRAALTLPSEGTAEGEADLAELLVALDSADAAERREAVRQLGISGDAAVPERLAECLLSDESAEVRLEAALALEAIGGEGAVPALHEAATSDASDEVREGAWAAIVSVAERGGAAVATPRIIDTLQHHARSPVRVEAAQALARLGDEAALGPLAAVAATDPVPSVRLAARVAREEIRRLHDFPEAPAIAERAGPRLDPELPPSREAPQRRLPGRGLMISGGVLAGVGLVCTITGFALLPGSEAVRFAIGLGLGIPGVLVAVAGVTLLVVGVLRRLAPASQSRRYEPGLLASRPPVPWNPRALSAAGMW